MARPNDPSARSDISWLYANPPNLRFKPVECLERTTEDKHASVVREGVVRAVLELEWGGGLRAVQRGGLRRERGVPQSSVQGETPSEILTGFINIVN